MPHIIFIIYIMEKKKEMFKIVLDELQHFTQQDTAETAFHANYPLLLRFI